MGVQWQRWRAWRAAAVAGLVLLAAGCSIGDIRRPAPTHPPASAPTSPAPSPRPPVGPDEVRRTTVPVPVDYLPQGVEFTDKKHGYALFVCGPARAEGRSDCPAILLATADGGHSWQVLRHPRPAAEPQVLLVRQGQLLLGTGKDDWYVSADRGRSFTHHKVSADLPTPLRSRFRLCCDPTPQLELEVLVDGRYRPAPTQPPVPGLSAVTGGHDRILLVAGVRDGRVYSATSWDEGKTWQENRVPTPDGEVSTVEFVRSSNDAEIWLVGRAADPMAFPQLWRFMGRWEKVSVAGHPSKIAVAGLAAINGGMLAVTGPSGSGVIAAGHYNDLGWPLGGDQVRVLDDGTLFSVHPDESIWLGEGWFSERRWIKILLVKA